MGKRYSNEFKEMIVELYNSGVKQHILMAEYGLSKSTVREWRQQSATQGRFGSKEILSPEAHELKKVKKELAKLEKELEILKYVALVLGTKKC